MLPGTKFLLCSVLHGKQKVVLFAADWLNLDFIKFKFTNLAAEAIIYYVTALL